MLNGAPVAVVTDSGTSLPAEILEAYNIHVIPFFVHLGGRVYRDRVDIDADAFFAELRTQEEPQVSTSVPPLGEFVALYEQLAEWAQGIVSIHIAGAQSGTCNTARLAAEESPIPVEVIDTETTGMAEGFVVLEAARAALEGLTLQDVVERARAIVPRVDLIALLETVSYAVQGGRLAGAARLIGNFLNIQPLVRVRDNQVSIIGQVRRRTRGLQQLVERVKRQVQEVPVHLVVHYTEDEAEGQRLLARLEAELTCVETYLVRVPIALGAHAGPGAIGVGYYGEGPVEMEEGRLKALRERLSSLLGDSEP
jgi:DegV family protein with EDD domain